MLKKVSIHEVAKKARVSPATVSNVVNRRRSTDDAIGRRVLAAVKELGYQPHRAAANLRSGKASVVAVIMPEIENPFFMAIVSALEALACDAGYELIVASSNEDEETEASRMAAILAWRPVGVIAIPTVDVFHARKLIEASDTPYVVLDRTSEELYCDTVCVDNRGAGEAIVDHLAEIGCRDLMIVASSLKTLNMRERCDGTRNAAQAHGFRAVKIVEAGKDYMIASDLLRDKLDGADLPDAIVAMTNPLTLSTLSATTQLGIRIPGDLALVGFDDYEWMLARATPVTGVFQPVNQIAEAAWSCLTARIAGSQEQLQSIRFDCELFPRTSTTGFKPASRIANNRMGRA